MTINKWSNFKSKNEPLKCINKKKKNMEEDINETKSIKSISTTKDGKNNHLIGNQKAEEGNDVAQEGKESKVENKKEEQDEWIVYVCNNSYGPYNLYQIIKLWNEKRINMMTTIFKKGENNWKYVYNDETLRKHLHYDDVNTNSTNVKEHTADEEASSKHFLSTTFHPDVHSSRGEENSVGTWKSYHVIGTDSASGSDCGGGGDDGIGARVGVGVGVSLGDGSCDNKAPESHHADLEKLKKREKKKKYLERKKKKIEEGLCDRKVRNSSIYITGLPEDVTKEEIHNVFKKAGIIKIDAESTEPKIKIYHDENNNVKGDALVTYVYTQSVDIAIKYFDNFFFRQNCMIHVEKAQFSKKKEGIKVSKEEILIKKRKIKAAKYEQLRLQTWGEVYTGTKKKIVIFRNVFSYEDALVWRKEATLCTFCTMRLILLTRLKPSPTLCLYRIKRGEEVCTRAQGLRGEEVCPRAKGLPNTGNLQKKKKKKKKKKTETYRTKKKKPHSPTMNHVAMYAHMRIPFHVYVFHRNFLEASQRNRLCQVQGDRRGRNDRIRHPVERQTTGGLFLRWKTRPESAMSDCGGSGNESPDHLDIYPYDEKESSILLNTNLQSFHDWLDNQSEDEEHEIMVE
ncbi:RNA-binding protein, putative [Plasmodium ovale wallikeri]|uniref:RNA-binding protein, putative n=1 Tax=Plasmodium ovale wallikeri TaxID=864142 RepID=A0A1A8YJD9_PLAOA|nr:RNA-binding protein, putative [Plasmodium ovale wallikeri]